MNKRTPPFFCLPSRAPDKSQYTIHLQDYRNVAIPIIKNRKV